ncbi:MAG: cation:proton antiporter [Gammaproteobacteria bacterium]|jgi:multicomponent Na+:H+ antiporter subunit D|nr:cation:proton antiporter [Gammaproteobacteria bacterium]|tara:strand:- start:3980 stop:5455 length:1476 start_codon:yes stop_codon:yes gene_type:complete
MNQIPILIITLPLLLTPILLLIRKINIVYVLTLVISLINIILILTLGIEVYNNGNIIYELGGWPAPIGIRLNADLLSCYFLTFINVMSFLCLVSSKNIIKHQIHEDNLYLFYIAWLLCNIGFSGIVLTDDIFNLFVFLEISSLSSYFLISQANYKGSLLAAIQYLFIGSIGAVFILLAIGILYAHTGTLNMHDLAMKIGQAKFSKSIIFSLGLLLAGIGIKSALFPLHGWLIKTYAYAPSIVTTYFSGTSTKIGIYILLRVFLDILNSISPLEYYKLAQFILFISLLGVLLSTFYAVKQQEVKKMLAYSSVAQLGYIIIAIMLLIPDGLTASLIHVVNHSIIKTGLFLIIAIIFINNQNVMIEDLSGLGKKYPILMSCFVVLGFGLIGLPITSGFISKWYLVTAMLKSEYWYFTFIVLLTSFMTLFYVWALIEKIYFATNNNSSAVNNISIYQIFCVITLTIMTIYLGLETSLTSGIAQNISSDFYRIIEK